MRPDVSPLSTPTVLDLLGPSPLLIDVLDRRGRIAAANGAELRFLKSEINHLVGRDCEDLYSETSIPLIRSLVESRSLPDAPFVVWMRTGPGRDTPFLAVAVRESGERLAMLKMPIEAGALAIDQEIRERAEILTDMIGSATDACWCIEFLQPIDISESEDRIVDAIFGHAQRWRACNDAMAGLYELPKGLEFNDQPVARYFPRSAVNEAMIRSLIRSGYRLDRAVAVDHRHDGSEILVENDFRAAIRGERLVRLWGTVRDIGPARRREQQLEARADAMLDLLSAAPDPILMLSQGGVTLAANPAVQAAWGWSVEQLLGRPIGDILDFGRLVADAGLSQPAEIDLDVRTTRARPEPWRFRVSPMEGTTRRFVVTGRPAPGRRRQPAREAAQ